MDEPSSTKRTASDAELACVANTPHISRRHEDINTYLVIRDDATLLYAQLPRDIGTLVERLVRKPRWLLTSGYYGDEHHEYANTCLEYDLGNGQQGWSTTWIVSGTLTLNGYNATCVVRGAPLVFDVYPTDKHRPSNLFLRFLEIEDRWEEVYPKAHLPYQGQVVSIGDYVYTSTSGPPAVLQCMNAVTFPFDAQECAVIPQLWTLPRYCAARSGIIVTGGMAMPDVVGKTWSPDRYVIDNAAHYDVCRDTWQDLPHLGVARHSHVMEAAGNGTDVYVFGGAALRTCYAGVPLSDDPGKLVAETERIDVRTSAWTRLASLPVTLHKHACSTFDDHTVVIWGGYTNDKMTAACYVYDIRADRFFEEPRWALPRPLHLHHVVQY